MPTDSSINEISYKAATEEALVTIEEPKRPVRIDKAKDSNLLLWNHLGAEMKTGLAEKAVQELYKLEGAKFIACYVSMLEFFAPKLGRLESINHNVDTPTVQIIMPHDLVQVSNELDTEDQNIFPDDNENSET